MKKWTTKSGHEIHRIIFGRSNVFLLTNGQTNVMIDTSVSRSWKKITKRLEKLNIKSVDYLILTHVHNDHVANAKKTKEKYKSAIIVHKEESGQLLTGVNILPKGTMAATKLLINTAGERINSAFEYEPCQADILIDREFDLREFGFNARLIHTPGHTIGSMSLIIDNEIALVGDTMFGIFRGSVFPPFADDVNTMIKSWGRLLETNCHTFIPSHGSANSRELVEKDCLRRLSLVDG